MLRWLLSMMMFAMMKFAMGTPAAMADSPLHPALWKVTRGATTVYLFGTVHALKRDTVWLTGPIADALTASNELVTEIDEREAAQAAGLLAQRGQLPAGTSLPRLIGPRRIRKLAAVLTSAGLSPHALDRDRPWFAALVLALVPMRREGFDPANGAEAALAAWPSGQPRPRHGLETASEQITMLAALPPAAQLAFLDGAINQFATIDRDLDTLLAAWGRGDAETLAREINSDMDDPHLHALLLDRRNRRWAHWIEARLAQPGTVFVAVGAGHLAGRGSVQDVLAHDGVPVSRVQ